MWPLRSRTCFVRCTGIAGEDERTSARIDDDAFPFREAELRAALALVMPAAQAGKEAGRHAHGLRAQRQSHDDFQARVASAVALPLTAHASPAADVPAFGVATYVWPELDCLALLHALSPRLAARVDVHRARIASAAPTNRWANDRRLDDDTAWRRTQANIRRLLARSGA